jgi:hypothetical protein
MRIALTPITNPYRFAAKCNAATALPSIPDVTVSSKREWKDANARVVLICVCEVLSLENLDSEITVAWSGGA